MTCKSLCYSKRSIEESRCIMEEQDREYKASLKADEEKVLSFLAKLLEHACC